MNIVYTGTPAELSARERTKLEGKLTKLGRVIERKGEREVHIFLSRERHLHKVQITMTAHDHQMVGVGADGELAVSMSQAIERLEKQVLKLGTKWRATRHKMDKSSQPAEAPPEKAEKKTKLAPKATQVAQDVKAPKTKAKAKTPTPAVPMVHRVNHLDGRKPMTLEEAMLEIGSNGQYLVYRDADTNRLCTLLRRGDGHLDLVEG